MNKPLPTYFVRLTQTCGIDQIARDYLWNHDKIGLHFPKTGKDLSAQDTRELDSEVYTGSARRAMRALNRLAQTGGYVLAEHWEHPEAVVGFVEPGSIVELYDEGRWDQKRYFPEGRTAVVKTLQLTRTQKIPRSRSAILLVGRPRQGTMMRWPHAQDMIANLVEGRTGIPGIRDLFPFLQEVLCAEFLRMPSAQTGLPQIESLLVPVGRTMRHIDILAIDRTGRQVAVQVTLQASLARPDKIAALKHFSDEETTLIFFSKDEDSVRDGIRFYPIEKAYQNFIASEPGRRWLAGVMKTQVGP